MSTSKNAPAPSNFTPPDPADPLGERGLIGRLESIQKQIDGLKAELSAHRGAINNLCNGIPTDTEAACRKAAELMTRDA